MNKKLVVLSLALMLVLGVVGVSAFRQERIKGFQPVKMACYDYDVMKSVPKMVYSQKEYNECVFGKAKQVKVGITKEQSKASQLLESCLRTKAQVGYVESKWIKSIC